jgi:3',5'-cyclic AMP phosphodiesterase CpdA
MTTATNLPLLPDLVDFPKDPLRIAVVSDVHAVDDVSGAHGNSNVRVSQAHDPKLNPVTALLALVEADDLKADLLLCPGDLSDKANPGGLRWAWDAMGKVAEKLGAEVLATTGNHDVDSRLAHKKTDTYGALLDLRPHFPIGDYDSANEFFARGVTVQEGRKARVVLLDSCFLHRERRRRQLDRGYLTQRVLDRVAEIASRPPANQGAMNIIVCHHQPLRWTEIGEDNRGEMRGGERLVRILERSLSGGWVLFHGHCHIPALDYLGQTSGGPVRFAAGSVGVALPANALTSSLSPNPQWSGDTYLRNQFYLLEIAPPGSVAGLGIAGTFRAWDWLDGWRPATHASMIPGKGGFGFRASGIDLAGWIAMMRPRDLTWEDLVGHEPRLDYLAPCDMNTLAMALRRGGHGVLQDGNGRLVEVSLA